MCYAFNKAIRERIRTETFRIPQVIPAYREVLGDEKRYRFEMFISPWNKFNFCHLNCKLKMIVISFHKFDKISKWPLFRRIPKKVSFWWFRMSFEVFHVSRGFDTKHWLFASVQQLFDISWRFFFEYCSCWSMAFSRPKNALRSSLVGVADTRHL